MDKNDSEKTSSKEPAKKPAKELSAGKIKFIKLITLVAIIAIAVTSGFFAVSSSYYVNNCDTKYVWRAKEGGFSIDLHEALSTPHNYTDKNIPIVKMITDAGYENILLPTALLSDEFERTVRFQDMGSTDAPVPAVIVEGKSKTSDTFFQLDFGYEPSKDRPPEGFSNSVGPEISPMFKTADMYKVNGIEVFVFSNGKDEFLIMYYAGIAEYILNIHYSDAAEVDKILKSLNQ